MDSLADRVKKRRADLGLTQADVVKVAGIKQPDLSKIERGDIKEPKKMLGLAKALRCNPDWLASGKGPIEIGAENTSHIAASPMATYLPVTAGYDQWTLGAIAIMSGLKEYQREGALAALKMYVAQLGPPRDGQALQMAG